MKRRNVDSEIQDSGITSGHPFDPAMKDEKRKIRKVIVERKRRERIDRCLDQLRDLLLSGEARTTRGQDGSGCPPGNLEKADILEMTLRHVRELQHRAVLQRCDGWLACLREIDLFLCQSPYCSRPLRQRLLHHLQLKRRDYTAAVDPRDGGEYEPAARHPLAELPPVNSGGRSYRAAAAFAGCPAKPIRTFDGLFASPPPRNFAGSSLRGLVSGASGRPSCFASKPETAECFGGKAASAPFPASHFASRWTTTDAGKPFAEKPDSSDHKENRREVTWRNDEDESTDVDIVGDYDDGNDDGNDGDDKKDVSIRLDVAWRPW